MTRRLVDATVAALHLRTAHGIDVAPATIRDWARRELIARHDDAGPARFNLDDVVAHALTARR